ncbi:hypothetical protein NC651_026132 [Populus alba x Populus x berolinensis]|nr:hypothetical protein NC651_026132 [Populus alba x Populus x berolinensis]
MFQSSIAGVGDQIIVMEIAKQYTKLQKQTQEVKQQGRRLLSTWNRVWRLLEPYLIKAHPRP